MVRITPYQITTYGGQLADIYAELQQDVFLRMAELLKTDPSDDYNNAIQWQVEKFMQLRLFNQENVEALAEATGISRDMIREIFREVGYDTIEDVDAQIARLGLEQLSLPTELDLLLQAYVDNTFQNLDNFVNLRLIDTAQFEGTATTAFKRVIEQTAANAIAGNMTINAALAQTIIRARERGIPSAFTAANGRTYSIQSYAETALRTTVNNAYNTFTQQRMEEYDIHLVRVDFYPGARETCSRIQGGVCSYRRTNTEGYPSIYEFGYGRPEGIRGINCKHRLTAFVNGISTNNNENVPTPEQAREREKMNQKQRSLERNIREAKRNLQLAEAIGDEEQIKRQQRNIRNRQGILREYIAQNDLPRRRDKERVF